MERIDKIKNVEKSFVNIKFLNGEVISINDYLIITLNDYKDNKTNLTVKLDKRIYKEDLIMELSDKKILDALDFLKEKINDYFKKVSIVLKSDYYGYDTLTSKVLYDFGEYSYNMKDVMLNNVREFLYNLKTHEINESIPKQYVDSNSDKNKDLESMMNASFEKKSKIK